MTYTHTYAILEVSAAAYEEIKAKLTAADYEHQFHEDDGHLVIDMNGIALQNEADGKQKTSGYRRQGRAQNAGH